MDFIVCEISSVANSMTSTGAMSRRSLFVVLILSILVQGSLQQYGHLEDPPARGSMWRYGFNTPVNNQDNSMNCGGKQVHTRNRLQCGVCGDAYDGPRAHEYGGRYATGLISKSFPPGTDQIQITVRTMSQQLGSYEFRICSKDNIHGAVTQECLDQNVLMVKDNTAVNSVFRPRYYVTPSIRNMPNHKITAKIPNGLTCKHCVLQWKFISVPDRNGYREEYINCADVSIGQITPVAGAGNLSPDPVASGASNLDNASTADMTNSELLEALLVLADVNPVPDKVTPLSNPISSGTQPEGNVAKHEELIHQLQSLGVLVPVDTPNQSGPNTVESLFTSPDAHSNPDYFLEQLQNLGVLVPVDPTPTSTNTAAQQPTSSQSSTSNMMQSIAPNINQSPGAHMMPQNQQQLLQPLQDIGVLVPVDQALKSGEQSNRNVFKAQETKIQNNRENELAKQLEGLGVIVPVGHIVQSPNNHATKDVPTSHDPFNVPRSPSIRPTNTFPSQSTHSNTFQSNNFQSSQSSQNTQTQRRKSQLGDIFNTNTASHNQKTSSQQARKSSSSFSSSQDGFVVSPQTFMESSSAMFSSSSSSFSSSGSAFSSSNTQTDSVEPPGANSQFGNFGSSPNRIQLNTDQQQQQQRTKSEQNTMRTRNNFSKFQSISPKSQFNNLSPQRWPQQQNQNSLSQNFQSRNSEGGFGLSGNNQQLLSPGGAFLGDVVQGSDKRQHGLQTLSSFDQGLSSPAGSLPEKYTTASVFLAWKSF